MKEGVINEIWEKYKRLSLRNWDTRIQQLQKYRSRSNYTGSLKFNCSVMKFDGILISVKHYSTIELLEENSLIWIRNRITDARHNWADMWRTNVVRFLKERICSQKLLWLIRGWFETGDCFLNVFSADDCFRFLVTLKSARFSRSSPEEVMTDLTLGTLGFWT